MRHLQKIFRDRYGVDQLSLALLLAGAVISLCLSLAGTPLASLPYCAVLLLSLVRAMSRNIPARTRENLRWLGFARRIKARLALWRQIFRERKVCRFLRCPGCHQMLRVPRGTGKIQVRCSRCNRRFIKKA